MDQESEAASEEVAFTRFLKRRRLRKEQVSSCRSPVLPAVGRRGRVTGGEEECLEHIMWLIDALGFVTLLFSELFLKHSFIQYPLCAWHSAEW